VVPQKARQLKDPSEVDTKPVVSVLVLRSAVNQNVLILTHSQWWSHLWGAGLLLAHLPVYSHWMCGSLVSCHEQGRASETGLFGSAGLMDSTNMEYANMWRLNRGRQLRLNLSQERTGPQILKTRSSFWKSETAKSVQPNLTVSLEISGGAGRDRTDDLLNAIHKKRPASP
jgi:hypothetical protein